MENGLGFIYNGSSSPPHGPYKFNFRFRQTLKILVGFQDTYGGSGIAGKKHEAKLQMFDVADLIYS